jgi:hypothetical protein
MKILIDDNQTIEKVQQEFSSCFPFLRLEFFSKPHKVGAGSEKRDMLNHSTSLSECRLKQEGELSISAEMTVAQLEKLFKDNYRLYVQVFRRSGKLWLETTATDNWTLNYQNEQGQELSSGALRPDDREEIDYHEQE